MTALSSVKLVLEQADRFTTTEYGLSAARSVMVRTQDPTLQSPEVKRVVGTSPVRNWNAESVGAGP